MSGPLINTIRVLCASYEDYSHWLLCLQTVSARAGGAPPAGLPGLWGSTQVRGPQEEMLPPRLTFWAKA